MSNFPNALANYLSVAGAISPVAANNYYPIIASSAIALTLAAPMADGQEITVQDTSGHAHPVTTPTNGVNVAHTTLTFGGTIGQFVTLKAVTISVGSPSHCDADLDGASVERRNVQLTEEGSGPRGG